MLIIAFLVATTSERMLSKLAHENIKNGVGRATWACLWAMWWCFLPRHLFHELMESNLSDPCCDITAPLLPPPLRTTSEPPYHAQPCHWQWAKCCCWYCSEMQEFSFTSLLRVCGCHDESNKICTCTICKKSVKTQVIGYHQLCFPWAWVDVVHCWPVTRVLTITCNAWNKYYN